LKVVHKNHLGLNSNNGTIHVDDWDGDFSNLDFKVLCGIKGRSYYELFDKNSLIRYSDLNFKLCKTCTKLALKKKRCLVSAVALLKLKGI